MIQSMFMSWISQGRAANENALCLGLKLDKAAFHVELQERGRGGGA